MALQSQTVTRVQDPRQASIKEITPINWHKFPAVRVPVGGDKPQFVRAQQAIGGVKGDDQAVATATLLTDQIPANGPNTPTDFSPRNQQQKADYNAAVVIPGATQLGKTITGDMTEPRGALRPQDPYPKAGDAPVAAPTLTGIAPATAAAGGADVMVRLTGTGFTPYSKVFVGGMTDRYRYVRYISPTAIDIVMDAQRSIAGPVTVQVQDRGVLTATQTFTYT